jgi:hypothetical protein
MVRCIAISTSAVWVIAMAVTFISAGHAEPVVARWPMLSLPTAAPDVTSITILFDTHGNRIGVLFRFPVQAVDKVEENRGLAERLLPDAIKYADAQGVPMVAIQAYQTTSSWGFFSSTRNYGYVWNKDAETGDWKFYVKNAS